jgi:uncharacterized membrane protein YgaE (UPF0421/DUF939 family)
MATLPKGKKPKPASRGGSPNPYSYPVPVDVAPVVETTEELVMGMVGWVVAVLLVAFMLPLLAFMYLDVLETKNEAKQQLEKVEKLRREVERKNRNTPEQFKDRPVFDRREKYE